MHADFRLNPRHSRSAVRRLVDRAESAVARAPRDARVVPSASGLRLTRARAGARLRVAGLAARVERALAHPTAVHEIHAVVDVVRPRVTVAGLAAAYPAYIVVDRSNFRLRLYRHLQLVATYPISVGRVGLETPAGLYHVQSKQVDPSWYVPDSPWAGDLAGEVIPPGPNDPLKARWMGFDGAAGIHGTDEVSSLGTAASHGCIRMAIPDVTRLYGQTPVGAPVYVG